MALVGPLDRLQIIILDTDPHWVEQRQSAVRPIFATLKSAVCAFLVAQAAGAVGNSPPPSSGSTAGKP